MKNGCYRLDDWNDPRNQIEQTLQLTPDGIRETALRPAQLSKTPERPVAGSPVKSGRTKNLVRHWRFDEGAGLATTEKQSGKACDIGGVAAYWRPGVSGTCLSFDSYSSVVTLPARTASATQGRVHRLRVDRDSGISLQSRRDRGPHGRRQEVICSASMPRARSNSRSATATLFSR